MTRVLPRFPTAVRGVGGLFTTTKNGALEIGIDPESFATEATPDTDSEKLSTPADVVRRAFDTIASYDEDNLLPSKCPYQEFLTLKNALPGGAGWQANAQSFCVVPSRAWIFVLYPNSDLTSVLVVKYRIDGEFIDSMAFADVGHGQGLSFEVDESGDLILWTGADSGENIIVRLNYTTGVREKFTFLPGRVVPGWVSNSYATPSLSPDGTEFCVRQVQASGPTHLFFLRKTDVLANPSAIVPTGYMVIDPNITTPRSVQGVAHGGGLLYVQCGTQTTLPTTTDRVLFTYSRRTGKMVDRVGLKLGTYGAGADHVTIALDPAAQPETGYRSGPEGLSFVKDHRSGGTTLYYLNQSAYTASLKVNRIFAFHDNTMFRTTALTIDAPIWPGNASVSGVNKPYTPSVKFLRIVYDGSVWVPWPSGTPGTGPSFFKGGITRVNQSRANDGGSGISIVLDRNFGSLIFAALQNDQSLNSRGIIPAVYDVSTRENSLDQVTLDVVFNDVVNHAASATTASSLPANSARFAAGCDIKIMLVVGQPFEQSDLGVVTYPDQ